VSVEWENKGTVEQPEGMYGKGNGKTGNVALKRPDIPDFKAFVKITADLAFVCIYAHIVLFYPFHIQS
jgi:hypothetical protein